MFGNPNEFLPNVIRVLSFVNNQKSKADDIRNWLIKQFNLSDYFARNIFSVLFSSGGLVSFRNGIYELTPKGKEILETVSPDLLLEVFISRFAGIKEIIEIVNKEASIKIDSLRELWYQNMILSDSEITSWSKKTRDNQFRHRLDWLRGLNMLNIITGEVSLSDKGLRFLKFLVEKKIKSSIQRLRISHKDIEFKMKRVGEFFEFHTFNRPSVNVVLPSTADKLNKEDRQLDGLWSRHIHFSGKVHFPIEIQISGSVADAIDRLETVSQYSQKSIIVTDQEQQEKILERLKAKRSALLDKLIFIDLEDVDKLVEAATVLGSFTQKVFA
ncbi:MAG: hypothetical protein Q7S39_12330 [Ignavibacteria bacterium]|nr:hypothetical protein [Ignavibacteria bacterium]